MSDLVDAEGIANESLYVGRGRRPAARGIRTHKRCGGCGEIKCISEFHKRKSGGPQSRCKLCSSKTAVDWARANQGRHNANVSAWRKHNADRVIDNVKARREREPERFREYSRRHYQKHIEKRRQQRIRYYYKNRNSVIESYRLWRLKNPAANAAKSMAYEARKRKAMPRWADKEKIAAVYRLCAEMTASGPVKYQVDHIYPLTSPLMCGLHVHYNLQIISAKKNQSKSNKIVIADHDAGRRIY